MIVDYNFIIYPQAASISIDYTSVPIEGLNQYILATYYVTCSYSYVCSQFPRQQYTGENFACGMLDLVFPVTGSHSVLYFDVVAQL